MTSKQLEERSQRLEARVVTLEAELVQMKQILSSCLQKESPWWLKVAGSFENDCAKNIILDTDHLSLIQLTAQRESGL
jgi:hypothetical protein